MNRMAVAIAMMLGVGIATPAAAQRSYHLGVGGGGAIPVGQLDSSFTTGAGGLVTLALGSRDTPVGIRIDYQYAGFNGKSLNGVQVPDIHIASITANVVVAFRAGYVKPYLIAGGGIYPFRAAGSTKQENDWGENGGAGLAFPLPHTGIGAFIEARYHNVNRSNLGSYHYVPVTVGVMF